MKTQVASAWRKTSQALCHVYLKWFHLRLRHPVQVFALSHKPCFLTYLGLSFFSLLRKHCWNDLDNSKLPSITNIFIFEYQCYKHIRWHKLCIQARWLHNEIFTCPHMHLGDVLEQRSPVISSGDRSQRVSPSPLYPYPPHRAIVH